VKRLEEDAKAGKHGGRCSDLLRSVGRTLDVLESSAAQGSNSQGHAEAVLAAYEEAEPHCIHRWEREVQMCHDLVCDDKTGIDAEHLEDIILRRLHVRRRRLAEEELHRAKGVAGISDMHFESHFYSNIHFGVLEQRDALLDPSRLNYESIGTRLNFGEIRQRLKDRYGVREIRSMLRQDICECKDSGSEAIRSKLVDWLKASVPDGFKPWSDRVQRQEDWLFEQCFDENYVMTDTALNFLLCRMRILQSDAVVDLFA